MTKHQERKKILRDLADELEEAGDGVMFAVYSTSTDAHELDDENTIALRVIPDKLAKDNEELAVKMVTALTLIAIDMLPVDQVKAMVQGATEALSGKDGDDK